ncbi:dienelactone hydrolase family protein [candidate division GN15 bacterium]|nr:dienelactone hydrolase family protein [candidate division GN15 bacterium]
MRYVLGLLLVLTLSVTTAAEIHTESVTYEIDGEPFEGYLAYDTEREGDRPGVLIIHQWMGLTDYEKMRARMLAELGYVAFAADIYGKGVRPQNRQEAGAEASKYRGDDRTLFRTRLNAGLAQLHESPHVDTSKLAAIGYCFGGGGVLELARSGAQVEGVVSFHGSLSTPDPSDAENIVCKVAVLHGAVDPYAPMEEVQGLIDEMEAAEVDYYITLYGGAVHSFTQEMAGDDPSTGAAYDATADRRSWRAMQAFFDEIFQ